jgi:hypothetical protein
MRHWYNEFRSVFTKFFATLVLGLGLTLGLQSNSYAQLGDIGSILQAGTDDAELLTESYLKPFANGFGSGINAGWVNTARPHKKLGFHIMIRPSLALVPSSDEMFDLSELALQRLEPASSTNTMTPTLAGDNVAGPEVGIYETYQGQRVEVASFNMPQGTGFPYVPAPTVQAGVGLIKKTELMLRYTPKIQIDKYGDFQSFGAGVKHDILQWLPGGKAIPIDLSVMVAFQNMNLGSDLDLNADDPTVQQDPDYNGNYDNQRVELKTTAYTVDAIVGKTLPFISVYGGLGFESSTMDVNMNGDYPIPAVNSQGQKQYQTITDPIGISMEGSNKLHALVGLRLKIAVLTIYAEYKQASYANLNGGIGISFR